MEQVFTTQELLEKERFSYWCEEFHRLIGCEFIMENREERFSAQVYARSLDNAVLCHLQASPHKGVRKNREIARSTEASVFFTVNTAGVFSYEHGGRMQTIYPGELLVFDTSLPMMYELQKTHNIRHQTVALVFKRDQLLSQLGLNDIPCSQLLNGAEHSPLRKLLADYLKSLAHLNTPLSDSVTRELISHFCGLLALSWNTKEELRETIGKTGLNAVRLQSIKNYVLQELNNPELSPTKVAKHFTISIRYLHKLFEETGLSFCQWVQQQRLERCYHDLLNPINAKHSIADIAYSWGFNDQSHFGRCFRIQYGMSPRELRRGEIKTDFSNISTSVIHEIF